MQRSRLTSIVLTLQEEFHGNQLVHMATLDAGAYPNFMKKHFTAKLRTLPSLKMFHKGHMVSHWKDHDVHKSSSHDVIKDFDREDFYRIVHQERLREAFGQFEENWGKQKFKQEL